MALVYKGKITRIINETGGVPALVRFRLAYFSDIDTDWHIVDSGDTADDPTGLLTITLTKGSAIDATNFPDYYYYSGHCETTGAYTLDIDAVEQEGDIGVPLLGMDIGNGAAGSISIIDATETFTNKTLTTPHLNEAVALAATATELNRNDGVVPGTISASKTVMANADGNVGVIKCTELHIGATSAEVQVLATPVEINAALDGIDTTAKATSIANALSGAETAPVTNDKILDFFDGFLDVSTAANDVDVTLPACDALHIGTEFCIYHRLDNNTLEINLAGDGAGDRLVFMTADNTETSYRKITSTTAGDCVNVKMISPAVYLVLGGKGVDLS